jgi:hypothetical protein
MTVARTMPLVAPSRESVVCTAHVNRPLLIAISIFLAVLIAEAAIFVAAAPHVPDLGSLYITST